MTNQEPISPVSALAAHAIQIHELFESFRRQGFTRAESLELVKVMMTDALKQD